MALSKIKAGSLAVDAVTSAAIADGAIVIADLANGSVTSAKLATMTTDVSFGDNAKVIFGAGGDLTIEHNGTNTVFSNNTGTLQFIQYVDNGNIVLRSDNGSGGIADYILAEGVTGEVILYHYGSEKLATKSTGIDVTGTVTADGLTVDTNTLHVDATNNRVGIGTTSPGEDLEIKASQPFLRLTETSDTGVAGIQFADTSDLNVGEIRYDHTSDSMRFNTADSEAMRIDSSGNLLVGKTAIGQGTAGFEARATGQTFCTDDGNTPFLVNRLTSDGELIQLNKDGTNVGSIGASFNDLIIHSTTSGHGGLRFQNGGMISVDNSGAVADNSFDIGASSYRFKDLYLSNQLSISATTGDPSIRLNDAGVGSSYIKMPDGTNDLAIETGGSERIRIDSSGYVGIGTSSPANPLHITKEIAGYQAYFNNDNGSAQGVKVRIKANDPGNFNILELVSASTLSDVTAMVVRDDGNVGIGTSSPNNYAGYAAITLNGTNGGDIDFTDDGVLVGQVFTDSNGLRLRPKNTGVLIFDRNNNAEAMRIASSGNIAIGMTNPQQTLHVGSSSVDKRILAQGNNAYRLGLQNGNSNPVWLGSPGADAFSINNSSGQERMRIDSSGRVGIGTTNPSSQLFVSSTNTNVQVHNTSATAGASSVLYLGGSPNIPSQRGVGIVGELNADFSHHMKFYVSPSAGSGTANEMMRITNTGRVGIGTSSPAVKLQVQSDSGTAYNPSTAAFNTVLSLKNNTSGASNNALMSFTTESNGEWYIGGVQNSGNTAADFVFASRASGARAERMRIDSGGNVGIGTSSPTERLTVVAGQVGTSAEGGIGLWNYNSTQKWNIQTGVAGSQNSSFTINDDTASATRMLIDTAGNLQFNSGYGSVATAYGCRAWVNFNGTGTVAIRDSGNVSSITDTGTGNYTVNFTTAMPDANYCATSIGQQVPGVGNHGNLNIYPSGGNPQSTNLKIIATVDNSTNDFEFANVAIFR